MNFVQRELDSIEQALFDRIKPREKLLAFRHALLLVLEPTCFKSPYKSVMDRAAIPEGCPSLSDQQQSECMVEKAI